MNTPFFYISNFGFLSKEEQEEENKKFVEKQEKEKERLDKISCPLCKSHKKENVVQSQSNGIIGPGSSSWVTESYLVCLDCGVMYKDLEEFKKQ